VNLLSCDHGYMTCINSLLDAELSLNGEKVIGGEKLPTTMGHTYMDAPYWLDDDEMCF